MYTHANIVTIAAARVYIFLTNLYNLYRQQMYSSFNACNNLCYYETVEMVKQSLFLGI